MLSAMHKANRILLFLFTLAVCLIRAGTAHAAVTVSQAAQWRIVLPADATPAERYAAEELRSLLEQSAGHTPVIGDSDQGRSRKIFVGAGEALNRRYPDWMPASHGVEGFRIVITRDHIAIAGGRPRGTLYGVYEFAERFLGVRFLTADHTHVPRDPARRLPHADFSYEPPFRFRWAFWHEINESPAFSVRLRNNGLTQDEYLGGGTDQLLIEHSLQHQVPVERHGDTNPEYFALVDGMRTLEARHAPQVDPLNPAVQDIVTEAAREELRRHPERRVISVSPADNGDYDEGWRSLALIEREGTPMAPHLTLVNEVARRIRAEHPGVMVGTLAYWATRRPPKALRPLSNVQIQLASFECSLVHALDDPASPANAAFMEDLDGWLSLTSEVYIWSYAANLRQVDVPIANLDTFAPTFRMLRDRGVKGIFSQGNGRCNAGEFSDLKTYVVSRLLWNPDLDPDELVAEFLDLHYGPAAKHIDAALALLAGAHAAQGGEPMSYPLIEELGLTEAVARKFMAHLNAARSAAGGEPYAERVDKLRIMGYKTLIASSGSLVHDDTRAYLTHPAEFDDWMAQYLVLTTQFGMNRNMEFEPLQHYLDTLERMREGIPVETLENEHWLLAVAPIEGAVIRLHHKPTGRELLPAYGSPEVRVIRGAHSVYGVTSFDGRTTPMTAERSPHGLFLTHESANGLRLEWELALEPLPPYRVLGSVTVHNAGESMRPARVHADFETAWPGDRAPALEAWDDAWMPVDLEDYPRSAAPSAQGGRLRLSYPGQPDILRWQFEPGQAESAASWAPGIEQAAVRLRSKRVPLAPGGRFMMRYVVSLTP